MKTTLTGFFAGLALIAGELNDHFDSDPKTVFSLDAFLAGLGMMGIGYFARDKQ
jgi:hypothetical protein